ncbi:MAG: hypothetical protein WCG80_11760 [Spirochaetales bacterium]
MKRVAWLRVSSLLATLLGFSLTLSAAPASLPDASDFPAVLSRLEAQGVRGEGSPAEARVFQDLRKWFERRAVGLVVTDFQQQQDFHSFSKSLWFRVAGRKPGELVVVVPTDGLPGQSNNAGLAWAIAWADRALNIPPPVSITYFFTGAQRGAGTLMARGTGPFLKDFFPETPAAAVVLDLDNLSTPIDLNTGSGAFPSPIWLSQGLLEALQAGGFLPEIQGTQPQIFRFDLPEKRNLMQPWFDRDIPALLLTNSASRSYPPPEVVQRDFPQSMTRFLDALATGIPGYWDKHYLYFHLGDLKFFLSQQTYLIGLLGILGIVLLVFLLFATSLQRDLGSLLRGLWQLPVFFSFLFLFLYSGTWWTSELFIARGFPDFWKYSALPVLLLKVSVAIGLYFGIFLQFRRLPLSRWPGFYSYAALLVLGLGVLVSAAIELSFSFYFLWALVFAALFHLVPWRPLKFVAFALSPLWFVKSFLEIFWLAPDPEMIRITLVSGFAGNLALAAVLFPFLLLVNSYHYTRHQRQERNEKHRSRLNLGVWVATSAVLSLVLLRLDPFAGSAVPLMRQETLDLSAGTRYEEAFTPVASGLPARQELPYLNGVWDTVVSREAFLDRLVWRIRFQAFEQPETVTLSLTGDNSLLVYDANFPYTIDATGTKVSILVGRTPPKGFDLSLTLGAKVKADLKVSALFTEPSDREWRLGRWYDTTRRIRVSDVRSLAP